MRVIPFFGMIAVFCILVIAAPAPNVISQPVIEKKQDPIAVQSPIIRISQAPDGSSAKSYCDAGDNPVITPDGRYVVFASDSNTLAPNDTNGSTDVFVKDMVMGTFERISEASDGTPGNAWSGNPVISGNGRYVAYYSESDNLVPNDHNGRRDVFYFDRQTHTTVRVNVSANGAEANEDTGGNLSISTDGRYVGFRSRANNLASNVVGSNGNDNIFRKDMVTGEVKMVSIDSNGNFAGLYCGTWWGVISPDGQYEAFVSDAFNYGSGNASNGNQKVYLRNRQTGEVTSISPGGNGSYDRPHLSNNGRYVVYQSDSDNLVPNDTNGCCDIFIYDTVNKTTDRISNNPALGESNGGSYNPYITPDGRYISFRSDANNFVPNDNNNNSDVFFYDRQNKTFELISKKADGTQGNSWNGIEPWTCVEIPSAISNDGRFVVFASFSDEFDINPSGNGQPDTFIKDRQTGELVCLNVDTGGNRIGWSFWPVLSATGDYAIVRIPGDPIGDALYVKKIRNGLGNLDQNGQMILANVEDDGTTLHSPPDLGGISADGKYLVFRDHTTANIYLKQMKNDAGNFVSTLPLTLLTKDYQTGDPVGGSPDWTFLPNITQDGRYIIFRNDTGSIVANDNNNNTDIFLYDRTTGITTLESKNTSGKVALRGASNWREYMTGDGRYIAFSSEATNFVPNGVYQCGGVFRYDCQTNTLAPASLNSNGQLPNDWVDSGGISADGRFIVFNSYADNLDAGHPNWDSDVFITDMATNTIQCISLDSNGVPGGGSSDARITADGNQVVFYAWAALVPEDTNGREDIYMYTRSTNTVVRVSVDKDGNESNGGHWSQSVSSNGWYIGFRSDSTNLVPGDVNGQPDLFIKNILSGVVSIISKDGSGKQFTSFCTGGDMPNVSSDGRYVVFRSDAINLVEGDTNCQPDVFVYDSLNKTIDRASVKADGSQGTSVSGIDAWWWVNVPSSISDDGRLVAFTSHSDEFDMDGDWNAAPNGQPDVFVKDRKTGKLMCVNLDASGNNIGWSVWPEVSRDGQYVLFRCFGNGDNIMIKKIFDAQGNLNPKGALVQVNTDAAGNSIGAADSRRYFSGNNVYVTMRASGSYIYRKKILDNNGNLTSTGELICVPDKDGNPAWWSDSPSLSFDGRYIAYRSDNGNIVVNDNNGCSDIFVYDTVNNTNERVSASTEGIEAVYGNDSPNISDDGRYVCFRSDAYNLTADDTNNCSDIFVYDRQTKTIARQSFSGTHVQGNDTSDTPMMTSDGKYLTFLSNASNLSEGDDNGHGRDVFMCKIINAPVFTAQPPNSGVIDQLYVYGFNFPQEVPIKVTAESCPGWLSVSTDSTQVTGRPGFSAKDETYYVKLKSLDARGASAYQSFYINVKTTERFLYNTLPCRIITVSLPKGQIGSSYSATLEANGNGGYAWSSSALPAGLSLSKSGIISGTPTSGGVFTVDINVVDSRGRSDQRTFTLTVSLPDITLNLPTDNPPPQTLGTEPQPPAINSVLPQNSFVPGEKLFLDINIGSPKDNEAYDCYVAVVLPGEPPIFVCLREDLTFATPNEPYAIVKNWRPTPGTYRVFERFVENSWPMGDYAWCIIMTRPGANPLDRNNWLSVQNVPFSLRR